jgi:alkaline phosphatase
MNQHQIIAAIAAITAAFAGAQTRAKNVILFFGDGVGVSSLNAAEDPGAVMTQPTAKTMAYDPRTKRVYLPAADVEVIPSADPAQRPQRKILANTFQVLVVRPLDGL